MAITKAEVREIVKGTDESIKDVLGGEDGSIDSKVRAIMDILHAEVDSLKDEIDGYKSRVERAEAKAKATTEESKTKDEWQKKYEKEHDDFEKYKADAESRETTRAKDSAYRQMLKDAGVSEKRIDSIMKLTDLTTIELEADGKVKDAKTVAETIKTEWADFITTQSSGGASTQTPPKNDNGGGVDLSTMSMSDYIKARTSTN